VSNPLLSRAHLHTAGRVALTVTALAAVTTGVIVTQGATGSTGRLDLAQADLGAHPAAGEAAFDQAAFDQVDVPQLRAARASAQARDRAAAAAEQADQAAREAEQVRRAAAERARAAADAAARSAQRDPRGAARLLLADHGWSGSQFSCLDALWSKESGWNPRARNAGSGAFGIPQALPGGKMASAGADWATNPVTQIRWGLTYIADVYGSPCGAWAHSRAANWY